MVADYLFMLKKHLNCIRRIDLECDELEAIQLEFKFTNSKPILVCYSYRPPSSKVEWVDPFLICFR